MRSFLFVGCGGSGGVTLQFLLDQLAADLSLRLTDEDRRAIGLAPGEVPEAWQFLHVDVPVAPDGVSGLPKVVTGHKNGSYTGLAPAAGAYGVVAGAVMQQLGAAGQLAQLGTWFTDPEKSPVPIALGAGQRREVGRVITLAGLKKVREGLTGALSKLKAPGVQEQLRAVTRVVSPGTEPLVDMPPVVVVVSSMAGGAGASMVLDVCRVLARQPGIDPAATALFLYTPEVFEELPDDARQGIPGNALAVMAELLATQLGAAAEDDARVFEAVGLGTAGPGRSAPFGRVIPIGARLGDTGARFGEGKLNQIYRGIGRGLAALMLSGEATQRWMGFDITNDNAVGGDTTAFGWTAQKSDLQWGSFGFAQLNMGRDRYAEYAAQRLARRGVLRLVEGHRQSGDPGTDQEQRDRVVADRLPAFTASLGLPNPSEQPLPWLTAHFDGPARATADGLLQRHVDRDLHGGAGAPVQQWLANVQGTVTYQTPAIRADARNEAYRHVHGWYERALPAAERAVEQSVSTLGLPATIEMLARSEAQVGALVGALTDLLRQWHTDPAYVDPAVLGRVQAMKGALDPRSGPVAALREAYAQSCYWVVLAAQCEQLLPVLASLRTELLEPLRSALADTQRTLDDAVAAVEQTGAAVQLRTDAFRQWPVDGEPVPARFAHAQNEVLLIDASSFPGQFDRHVLRTMDLPERPVGTPVDALELAAREVVAADWPTTGAPAEEQLLERRARWRPSSLTVEPGSDEPVQARRGQYRLAANPAELLARARTWTGRARYPFEEYVSTSLRDYVNASDLSESVRNERVQEVQRKFRETLQLAQPLVALDANLVGTLHGGYEAKVAYKFSEVPFGGLALGEDLTRHLEQSGAHTSSTGFLTGALRTTSRATRVDVFGSYAPLAPLVFTSLLKPLAQAWSEALMPNARESFFKHRRSRRLPGAVPMPEAQRRAIVAGWYVARTTGRLRLPGQVPGVTSVQVWDEEETRWVSFPSPLIVPQVELDRAQNNYLPAVLLTYSLAAAQVTATGQLDALHPYLLLRRYWDDSPSGIDLAVLDDPGLLAAARHYRTWFAGGALPQGAPSTVSAPTGVLETDRKAVTTFLEKVRDSVARDYLPPSEGGLTGGGKYSEVKRPGDLWKLPLFHEVAADVLWATTHLLDLLDRGIGSDEDDEDLV